MQYDLANMTSPEAAEAIARSRTAVLPIGSIEQHGPHLPNGTDTFAAELVAREVADRLDAVFVPFGPYGVTPIHAGHPGTVTLRRETFEALLTDICTELIAHGRRDVRAGQLARGQHRLDERGRHRPAGPLRRTFVAAQACYVAQRLYREEGGELTHGGRHRDPRDARPRPRAGEGRPGGRADPAAGRHRDGRDAPLARGLRLHHRRHRALRRRLVRQSGLGHARTRRDVHQGRRRRGARTPRRRHEGTRHPTAAAGTK